MRWFRFTALMLMTASTALAADDLLSTPRPVPLTRPEMKKALEDMKSRKPRIPLPELTEADREALGERADSYESRLRYHFLPGGVSATSGRGSGGFGFGLSRGSDPDMTLDYGFTVELFWIASRTNNCQY